MSNTNKALIGLLVALAAVGVYLWVRALRDRPPPLPPEVLAQQVERIDVETYEVVTLPRGRWRELGHRRGLYRNPNTKKYTMATPMTCASCGQKIPMPKYEGDMDRPDPGKYMEAVADYTCPRCGEPASGGDAPMR